jgi:hypothetical protein
VAARRDIAARNSLSRAMLAALAVRLSGGDRARSVPTGEMAGGGTATGRAGEAVGAADRSPATPGEDEVADPVDEISRP